MALQTLPEFTPGQPAGAVDAALRQALAVADQAHRCAVLWFAEVQRRELYRVLGHASLELYAVHRLSFSRNRFWQFKRLADDLDRLPSLREAVADGRVGWTKAQQVARVATSQTEAAWVERAGQCGRRELAAAVTAEVARVRGVAREVARGVTHGEAPGMCAGSTACFNDGAGQLALGLGAPVAGTATSGTVTTAAPSTSMPDTAIPATVALRADALQVARFEALVERARKQGRVPAQAGRMELVLAALERLVDGTSDDGGEEAHRARRAPVQIVVHQCPDCAAATVTTATGERPLAPAQVAALACDAQVLEPGRPNRATIPPRVRRAVLARDRHRCTTPGCGATAFLEVHHMVQRRRGGSNQAANLVTLCGRCHAFAHEEAPREAALAPAQVRAKVPDAGGRAAALAPAQVEA